MRIKKNRWFLWGWIFLIAASLSMGCGSFLKMVGWEESDPGERKVTQFLSGTRPYRGNPDSHYLLACYYQERGRHREAIEELKKTLIIEPNYVKAYNGLGVSYDLLGDHIRAMESYRRALSLDPNLDYVYNNLGYSYFLQGRLDEAIFNFKKAIALNDRNPRFHNNLAMAFGEKGEYELAFEEFKLVNDESIAHYYMAQIYFKKNRFEEARDHYTKALKLNPSLTIAQTSLDASIALAKIFGQKTSQEATKQFVLPEQPTELADKMEPLKVVQKVEPPLIKEVELPISKNILKEEYVKVVREGAENKESRMVALWMNWRSQKNFETKLSIASLNGAGIEISNGNGVNRMAKKVGNYLKEKGFKVDRLTNANHFRYPGTKIIYQKNYDQAAEEVALHIPVYQIKEEIEKLDRPNIKVKIVIGRDLVPYLDRFENGEKS